MLLAAQQQTPGGGSLYILHWVEGKLRLLEERATTPFDRGNFEAFKREVTQNFRVIVSIDVWQAIRLVNERFAGNHKDIIDQLGRDPQEQLAYLDALLARPGNPIQDTILAHVQESTNAAEAKKCLEVLKLHLRLCCQLRPQGVLALVERKVISKNSCYPIEDCLQICQEFKQAEAVFLLSKKLGKYFDSVS